MDRKKCLSDSVPIKIIPLRLQNLKLWSKRMCRLPLCVEVWVGCQANILDGSNVIVFCLTNFHPERVDDIVFWDWQMVIRCFQISWIASSWWVLPLSRHARNRTCATRMANHWSDHQSTRIKADFLLSRSPSC